MDDIHIRTEKKIDALTKLVQTLIRKVNLIMSDLDQIKADEDAEGAAIATLASALTKLIGSVTDLKAQLAAALSSTTIPPAVQTKIDAVFAEAEVNKAAAQAAVASIPTD